METVAELLKRWATAEAHSSEGSRPVKMWSHDTERPNMETKAELRKRIEMLEGVLTDIANSSIAFTADPGGYHEIQVHFRVWNEVRNLAAEIQKRRASSS